MAVVNFIFLSNYLYVTGRQVDLPPQRLSGGTASPRRGYRASWSTFEVMPELFEHLQAEPSAASRHKPEVVGHTLSSALDEQTCGSTSEQPKAQLAGARTAQASPRRYSSSLEASTRACGAPGEPLRRKVDLSTSDMQIIAQENGIDNGNKLVRIFGSRVQ